MTWIYLLKDKSGVEDTFRSWKAQAESECNRKIKCYHTDNGGEFTLQTFEKYLREAGIRHEVMVPYTSAENGRAERTHRTIMDRTRAMLSDANLPPKMWGECALTSVYIKNRTPTHTLLKRTPYEAWYNQKPDVSHMREIGCKAWVLNHPSGPKISVRSTECVLVGYSPNSKAYRCYNRKSGHVTTTWEVTFIESQDEAPRPYKPGLVIDDAGGTDCDVRSTDDDTGPTVEGPLQDPDAGEPHDVPGNPSPPGNPMHGASFPESATSSAGLPESMTGGTGLPEPRRSGRDRAPTEKGAALAGAPRDSRTDRAMREVRESARRTRDRRRDTSPADAQTAREDGSWVPISPDPREHCSLGVDELDPRSFKEAMSAHDAESWKKGIADESASLKAHKVWQLIPRESVPVGRHIIKSKLHFHRKRGEKGNVVRCKVRCVAKGFTQMPGIDYAETFAPVARMEAIRSILHIGAVNDWEIDQLDVKTAFLHGELEEELYMEQPEGAKEPGREGWVCALEKTLYGLKQASERWYKKLHHSMVKEGYQCVSVDHSVYTRTTPTGTSIVATHVDDMLASASTPEEMAKLKRDLKDYFDLVDMGPVRWLLGIHVERNWKQRTIALSQTSYVETIVDRFNLVDSY